MEFLKALTFSREGCFEPAIARLDLSFTLHEFKGCIVANGEDASPNKVTRGSTTANDEIFCCAVHVTSPSNDQDRIPSTRVLCNVSESCVLKTVPTDATLFLQVWAGGSLSDIERMAFSGGGGGGGGEKDIKDIKGTSPSRATARYIGEVRVPVAAVAQSYGMLYYSWLALDTLGDTMPNMNSDLVIFEQSLYAGPRNPNQPKLCVTLCKELERGRLPFRIEEDDSSFRARAWAALVRSHQQHLSLSHALSIQASNHERRSSRNEVNSEELEKTQRKNQLLESVVQEHKRENVLLHRKLEESLQRQELRSQELQARTLEAELGKERLQGELDETRSAQTSRFVPKDRLQSAEHEQETLKAQVAKLKQENADLLQRSNAKIDDANRALLSLQSAQLELEGKLQQAEFGKKTAELDFQEAKARWEVEKTQKWEAENATLRQENASACAKNEELLKIVTALYDQIAGAGSQTEATGEGNAPGSGMNVTMLDRGSLDAYTVSAIKF